MSGARQVILSIEIKKELLEKYNKAFKTYYQIKDIQGILEYTCSARNMLEKAILRKH